ncbi:MAG: hypothetical protein ACXAE3_11765 [Candidatus Kariarchaeaceae archaeon]|jgi:hypothetical protein
MATVHNPSEPTATRANRPSLEFVAAFLKSWKKTSTDEASGWYNADEVKMMQARKKAIAAAEKLAAQASRPPF